MGDVVFLNEINFINFPMKILIQIYVSLCKIDGNNIGYTLIS